MKNSIKKIALTLFGIILLFSSFAPDKNLTWMAIGDSITYLNGKPAETKNKITKGYLDRVVEKLPYIHYTNCGHGRWTAKSIGDNINNLGLERADFYSRLYQYPFQPSYRRLSLSNRRHWHDL